MMSKKLSAKRLRAFGSWLVVAWLWLQARFPTRARFSLVLGVVLMLLVVQWWLLPVYVVVLVGDGVAVLRL
jgi:hypothetical protein